MGTRGAIGFIKNKNHKVTYNHYDSYPDGLGLDVLEFCRRTDPKRMDEIFNEIEMVEKGEKPTDEQKKRLNERTNGKFTNLNVSSQSEDDWYCLLRDAQGNLDAYAQAGFMIDSKSFLHESLFCEWAYLINLDTRELECYEGFQKSKPKGRYSHIKPEENGYYAVGLVKKYNLYDLPSDKQFIKDLEHFEDKDQ